MSYNFDPQSLQRQLEDMQRQYRQLAAGQPQQQLPPLNIQPPAPVVVPHQIQYVEGIAGARMYQDGMAANSSEIIMDKDDDVFYRVSKDANGIPSKKIAMARFTIEEPQESDEQMYLTKKDLNDFKEEIIALFQKANKSTPTQSKILLSKEVD